MNFYHFLMELISYLALIPAALLCFFPMKNQLRYRKSSIILYSILLLVPILPTAAFLDYHFSLDYNTLFLPLLFLFFFVYHQSLKVHISKSLGIFALVCAMMSFLFNFATGFDALLHPTSDINHFSTEATLFQLVINVLFTTLMFHPFQRYGSSLINTFDTHRVWYISILISGIFLVYNLLLVPHKYETLYTNRVFLFFWSSLFLLLVLLLLLCVFFYFIVNGMLTNAKTEERNRILEMQELQYITQQRYIESTAKARHDFKHTIRTLKSLYAENNIDAIGDYLDSYMDTLPENDMTYYCKNRAVNALLNFYAQSASSHHILTNWRIDLPETTNITDMDLCSIFGNILENAINACTDIPEKERFIHFTVTTVHNTHLCIAENNSFSGKVKRKGERYLSTHQNGNGIGLTSIISTTEHYGGSVRFYHKEKEFFSDVMLPIQAKMI